MENYKKYFKGKRITVMGLGILGRGLGYTQFLAQCGADLIVTDLKPSTALRSSLEKLRKYRNIKFVLGKHRLQDFKNRDMIIKNPGVPLNSAYIKEARKNGIPIEMDVSLFAKLAPEVTVVGVTGTRGKSMTTVLIYEILKQNEKLLKRKVYLGGNIRGIATLPLLKKVQSRDILVCELDSWQLQGFGEAGISPHIAVFTTFMEDHMNYYKGDMKKYFADKANIFKYQKEGDVLIVRPDMKKLIPSTIKSKLIVARASDVAKYPFTVPGKHQQENLACAVQVAKQFRVPLTQIKNALKNFKGVEGRLQYVKTVKGVKIYNDNNATTPKATCAGIEALSIVPKGASTEKKIVLIVGGSDKNLDLSTLGKVIKKYCKSVVLLPGTGTDKLVSEKLKVKSYKVKDLKGAVAKAMKEAKKGDIILFSPAFASFGLFNNEYDRNDQFMKIIKKLK